MRWGSAKPTVGDLRVVKKFLLYPRRLGGQEWRWLEVAYVVEQYREYNMAGDAKWFEKRFATDPLHDRGSG